MRGVGLTLATALVTLAGPARANPLDMYGFGARSTALAGAVSADVGDTSAVYYNPAGLARLRGLRIDVGYFRATPALRFNGLDTGVSPSQGLAAGIAAPGRVFGLPFAIGVGVHLPDDRISQVRAVPQGQPRWELYGVRLQRVYIAAMLAVAPVRWLRLGAGMAFMASTRGDVDIQGLISVTSSGDTSLAHAVDADLTAVRYAQAGAQVDLPRGVTAAFVWRDEFRLDLDISLALRGRIVAGPPGNPGSIMVPGAYQLASRTLTAFQPQQWVLGAAWVINPRWRVMADVTWARWSRYENPTSALETSLDVRIPASLSGVVRVPAIPPSAPREPPRFHDTFVPRVGVEYTAPLRARHALHARLGYAWDPSPVPDQPGVTSFYDSDRHVVAAGLGVTLRRLGEVLPGSVGIDLAGSVQLLPERTFTKASPVDPVGDVRAGGLTWSLAATASVAFE